MKISHWLYFGLLAIVATIGILRYNKLNTSNKAMLLLVFITILSEGVATYLKIVYHTNVIVYHVFGPIEVALIVWAFFSEFQWRKLLVLIVMLVFFGIINSFFIQSYKQVFNSYFFVLDAFVAVLLSITYLFKLLNQKEFYKFTDYPMFWISTGFLIFYLTNLIMLGTFNVVKIENEYIFNLFLQIRTVTNLLLYILFGVSFLGNQRMLQIR